MHPIVYILHSGKLYGTERMALATLIGLEQQGRGLLLAPPGPVHAEAERLGIVAQSFSSTTELAQRLWSFLRCHRHFNLIATGVSHSLMAQSLAWAQRCSMTHVHVVHGGTDERLSYGRKALLGQLPVTLVAVSDFVRERLLAHGCRDESIRVVENFLPAPIKHQRDRQTISSIRRVALVSRIDPIKRVHLLLEAIERQPALRTMQFEIFGEGSEYQALKARAAIFPNLKLHGFCPDAAEHLAEFDLLLHTCAEEPFGLAILEAMASGIPVLVPNAGGAGSLVEDGRTGFHFPANCSGGLANRLLELQMLPREGVLEVIAATQQAMAFRFAPMRGLAQYAALLA